MSYTQSGFTKVVVIAIILSFLLGFGVGFTTSEQLNKVKSEHGNTDSKTGNE